jgi:hypothetical protein
MLTEKNKKTYTVWVLFAKFISLICEFTEKLKVSGLKVTEKYQL